MIGIQLLFQIISFLDIRFITIKDTNYLVVFERGTQSRESAQGFHLIQTNWHIWGLDSISGEFKELYNETIFLPGNKTIDISVDNDNLYCLAESNLRLPVALVKWSLAGKQLHEIATEPDNIVRLNLTENQLENVNLNMAEGWSAPYLAPKEWLFHPSIYVNPENGMIIASVNSALADAVVMEYKPDSNSWEEKAFIPEALEPKYYELSNHSFLAYRKTTERWLVNRDSRHYSFGKANKALPFVFVELDSTGKVKENAGLKNPDGVETAYIFDLAGDGEKRLALATVSGMQDKPLLSINISEDLGHSWQQKGTYFLEKIPERISLTINSDEAYVGLVFLEEEYYQAAMVRCGL